MKKQSKKLAKPQSENPPPALPPKEPSGSEPAPEEFSQLEERLAQAEQKIADMEISTKCMLEAFSKVEKQFGVRYMRKGKFYGIEFG